MDWSNIPAFLSQLFAPWELIRGGVPWVHLENPTLIFVGPHEIMGIPSMKPAIFMGTHLFHREFPMEPGNSRHTGYAPRNISMGRSEFPWNIPGIKKWLTPGEIQGTPRIPDANIPSGPRHELNGVPDPAGAPDFMGSSGEVAPGVFHLIRLLSLNSRVFQDL